MKLTRICAAALLSIQLAGCSGNAELDAANAKIASLEAQLASEKARNGGADASSAGGKNGAKDAPAAAKASASAPAPGGQQWKYDADEDKMTGKTVYHATVKSSNTVDFTPPYSGAQHGSLVLRSGKGSGKDVIFTIQKGQIMCHSYQDCHVLVRFDDEKPVVYAAAGPSDNSSETIFLRGYDKFAARMRKAKMVRISVDIFQQGSPVFEFDVSGFDPDRFQPKGK